MKVTKITPFLKRNFTPQSTATNHFPNFLLSHLPRNRNPPRRPAHQLRKVQRKAANQLPQGDQPSGIEETGRVEETAGQVRPGGHLQEQVREAQQAVLKCPSSWGALDGWMDGSSIFCDRF